MNFNFVKHWPIRNLFNDEIFPIYCKTVQCKSFEVEKFHGYCRTVILTTIEVKYICTYVATYVLLSLKFAAPGI